MILHKSSVTLCDCLCDKSIFTHKKSIPKIFRIFSSQNSIYWYVYMFWSYKIFLLPSYQSIFSQRHRAYNVIRPLSLSGRASEIKKVRICIFPNAFAMLRSTMHIPHVLLLNIKFWHKVPLLSFFPTWM